MRYAVIAALLAATMIVPAGGQPSPPTITEMNYNVFEFPAKHRTGWNALRRSLPSPLKSVPWIYDLGRKATTGPVVKVTVRGRVHYGGFACKPHDCADNTFVFLVAEDGSNVVALLRSTTMRDRVVGQPNTEELVVLNRLSAPGGAGG